MSKHKSSVYFSESQKIKIDYLKKMLKIGTTNKLLMSLLEEKYEDLVIASARNI